jgi:hypothetical protein
MVPRKTAAQREDTPGFTQDGGPAGLVCIRAQGAVAGGPGVSPYLQQTCSGFV